MNVRMENTPATPMQSVQIPSLLFHAHAILVILVMGTTVNVYRDLITVFFFFWWLLAVCPSGCIPPTTCIFPGVCSTRKFEVHLLFDYLLIDCTLGPAVNSITSTPTSGGVVTITGTMFWDQPMKHNTHSLLLRCWVWKFYWEYCRVNWPNRLLCIDSYRVCFCT